MWGILNQLQQDPRYAALISMHDGFPANVACSYIFLCIINVRRAQADAFGMEGKLSLPGVKVGCGTFD